MEIVLLDGNIEGERETKTVNAYPLQRIYMFQPARTCKEDNQEKYQGEV